MFDVGGVLRPAARSWLPSFALAVASLCVPKEIVAQEELQVVVVTGTGRVEIEPDYATVTFGVSVRESTPSAALRVMNERLDSIAAALEAVGLPWDSIPTAGFSVRPEEDRSSPGRPIVGFTAAATLRATLRDFSRIPIVIEEALRAGANTVTGVVFESTRMEAARDEALRRAVARARRQAEVIAEGLGRELGPIIEVITPEASRIVGQSVSLAASRLREIVPQLISVSQTVSVRWRLRDRPR